VRPAGVPAPGALLLLLLPLVAACAALVDAVTPPKAARPATGALAHQAIDDFWRAFRDARYDAIPAVHERLTAAYAQHPHDPYLTLLLGHTHFWRAAERARLDNGPSTIADHLILAERYLDEARRLAPDDARIPGWLGGLRLALGSFHADVRLTRRAYLDLRAAVDDYVEFNGFSFAYPLISQPPRSPRIAEAVAAMWRTVEACNQERYDRDEPGFEYRRFAHLRTATGRTRVCWNTPLVPHNMEGFFLHFGDLLLKAGHDRAARSAYELIHQVPEYAAWRFKDALADRLERLAEWSRTLRDGDAANDPPYMLRSVLACTGCHAT
jgi:hypothetical protein